jgi:hypothetical protein
VTLRARLSGASACAMLMAAMVPVAAGRDASQDAGRVRKGDDGTRVYIDVPAPADVYGPRGPRFHGQGERLEVPGSVTINVPPYGCDLDDMTFRDKGTFTAHLRTLHSAELEASSAPFVIDPQGQVRFVGR